MIVTAVVGANFGDEGKGRIVDALAPAYDYVVRFQGGANAGHTILTDEHRFVLHQLPSGVLSDRPTNVIGPGAALDIEKLCVEIESLGRPHGRSLALAISDRAQVLLPWHRQLDVWEEERLGARAFGSTQSGIAPCYADKHAKLGIQVGDLFDDVRLRDRLEQALAVTNARAGALYGRPAFDLDPVVGSLRVPRERIARCVCDTTALLHQALEVGRPILLEGQLGALRDSDHGVYPFVTSVSTLAGFATVGAGVPPWAIGRIVAVTKAYSTCVGAGPFVTELRGADALELQTRGGDAGEYGATTGRPRRVGWFDAVATRYGCRVQGATEVALTCLDVLSYLDEIPICTAYQVDGRTGCEFPAVRCFDHVEPAYERLPGWRRPIGSARTMAELPPEAAQYVDRLQTSIGVPIRMVSVGPQRDAWIRREA